MYSGAMLLNILYWQQDDILKQEHTEQRIRTTWTSKVTIEDWTKSFHVGCMPFP